MAETKKFWECLPNRDYLNERFNGSQGSYVVEDELTFLDTGYNGVQPFVPIRFSNRRRITASLAMIIEDKSLTKCLE